MLARLGLNLFLLLPFLLLLLFLAVAVDLEPAMTIDWLWHLTFETDGLLIGLLLIVLTAPITFIMQCIAMR